MTRTHTYALLEVPAVVYSAVLQLLTRAGHEHATNDKGEIDMHGIALVPRPGARMGVDITVASILSRDNEGRIEFSVNGEVVQLDVRKAREVVQILNEAIEAAITDEMLYKFLTGHVGADSSKALAAIAQMREVRQGSRDGVIPS